MFQQQMFKETQRPQITSSQANAKRQQKSERRREKLVKNNFFNNSIQNVQGNIGKCPGNRGRRKRSVFKQSEAGPQEKKKISQQSTSPSTTNQSSKKHKPGSPSSQRRCLPLALASQLSPTLLPPSPGSRSPFFSFKYLNNH